MPLSSKHLAQLSLGKPELNPLLSWTCLALPRAALCPASLLPLAMRLRLAGLLSVRGAYAAHLPGHAKGTLGPSPSFRCYPWESLGYLRLVFAM